MVVLEDCEIGYLLLPKENYYFHVLRMERMQAQSREMSSSLWRVCCHAVPILLLISLWCLKWVYQLAQHPFFLQLQVTTFSTGLSSQRLLLMFL